MMKSFTNYQHRTFSRIYRTLLTSAALVAGLLTGSAPQAEAQIVYNEPFTVSGPYPQLILPRGWSQGKIIGSSTENTWEVVDNSVASGNNPNPNPFPTTPNVVRFNSFWAAIGDASFLASKRFDMRNIPGAGTTFTFKMYRDAGYTTSADRIQVYLNDSATANPSFGSMTLLNENGSGFNTINRYMGYTPVVGTQDWYTYNYTIPQLGWNTANVYVIIVATSAFGNDIFIDDFQITSYPVSQSFSTAPAGVYTLVQQNTSTTAPGATNQQIIGLKFTMSGYGNGAGSPNGVVITDLIFNTNGSTNPVTDINNAKLWTTGGSPNWSPANAVLLATHTSPHFTNFGFFIPNVAIYYPGPEPTSYNTFEHGENYLWITYDIKPGATSNNFVDAEWVSIKYGATTLPIPHNGTTIFSYLPGARKIDVVYCQPTYTVGTSWLNYVTNDYINAVELDGDVVPGIQNGIGATFNARNRISAYAGGSGNPCYNSTPSTVRLCPWQSHQPDYETFPENGYNAIEHGVTVTQTTAVLTAYTNRVSSPGNPTGYTIPGYGSNVSYLGYPLNEFKLQVGNYGSSNAIAAWIDYTGDGVFNNYFDNILKAPQAASAGSTILNIRNTAYTNSLYYTYGLNVGMKVYGPGIPVGTYITAVNSITQITISAATTGAIVVGNLIEFVNDGTNGSPGNRGEKIAQSGPLGAWGLITPQFKVPDWANSTSGKRRLRVREVWINYNITPCNTNTYGETEDYTITVRPECPIYTGPDGPYKTWLGFSDNWSDPANWCPEGAPLQGGDPGNITNLRFPGGPTGAVYPYTKAKIATGQQARAWKFRIETGDTVFIDAPQGSDLQVTDSLIIQTPSSALMINTSRGDTAQMYNGVLMHNYAVDRELINMSPLRVSQRVRSQWLFHPDEFILMGMKYSSCAEVPDMIDTIRIHMLRKSNGNVYKNLKIRYFYTGLANTFNTWASMTILSGATRPCFPVAPVTVYSGDLNVSSIPDSGWGTIAIPLTTGIPFYYVPSTAVSGKLVIDISYDQTAFPYTGADAFSYTNPGWADNEDIRHTQTANQNWFMTWSSYSNGVLTTADVMPPDLHGVNAAATTTAGPTAYAGVSVPCSITAAVGVGATSIPVSSITGFYVGMTYPKDGQTQTGQTPVLWGNRIVGIDTAGLTLTFAYPITAGIASGARIYGSHYQIRKGANLRPNMTFSWKRVYRKYPVEVKGPSWTNNGNFVPAISRVAFSGTNTDIEGTVSTTFFDLDINNSAAVRLDGADISVQDSLRLVGGLLKFNNRQVTLLRPEKWAMTWTAGRLQMDNDIIGNNVAPFSRLKWNMDTATDLRILPLVNVNNAYLPMSYKPSTGTHNVTFTTYRTNPDNTNIPSPTVTNIFGWTGSGWGTSGDQLADRFYRIENLDAAASVDYINFSYQGTSTFPASERAGNNSSGATTMQAQRWLNDTTKWEQFPSFHPTQTYYPPGAVDSVRVNTFTFGAPYGYWWVMTGISTPLPVELLEFTAVPYQDRVKLKWSTASEINSSHYIVERTVDNHDFSFIGQVQANGTTSAQSDYSLWDYKPVEGIQYYYLRQYDRDGHLTSYGPVSAKFTKEAFEIVTATISSSESGLQVVFNYDSEEPVNYRIIDMTGRVVASKDRNPATPGLNVIDIDVTLAKGAYQIILMNRDKQVTRKFFY